MYMYARRHTDTWTHAHKIVAWRSPILYVRCCRIGQLELQGSALPLSLLMDPRARAVREYVLMPEQPGAHMQQAALFGQPSAHALAAVVATIQQHAESLEDTHVVNAVALVSAIAAKADGSSECADCFPEACACAETGLARLVGQLAALEGAALSISQRGQRGALEKLLCQAISSAATDPPLARATIGALRRAAGEESREGVETLGLRTQPHTVDPHPIQPKSLRPPIYDPNPAPSQATE